MRVPRTRLAEEDLYEIWRYIALDDIEAADQLLDELEAAFLIAYQNPGIGRDRPVRGLSGRS